MEEIRKRFAAGNLQAVQAFDRSVTVEEINKSNIITIWVIAFHKDYVFANEGKRVVFGTYFNRTNEI